MGIRSAASGPMIKMRRASHNKRVRPPQRDADQSGHAAVISAVAKAAPNAAHNRSGMLSNF